MRIDFDKRDSVILKGLAITAIVFHNFYHLAGPVHENEFTFDPTYFWVFVSSIKGPTTAIEGFFSFFGHFGVEVFVFFAAYGLAKSHWDDPSSWGSFLWGRIKKLYPVFGLVVLLWLILMAFESGPAYALKTYGPKLFWMFACVSNFKPGYGLPPVGPWWFIPFIVQFYALWPLLRWFTKGFGERGLIVLAVLSVIFVLVVNRFFVHRSMSLIQTPIGHMPEFCFGIAAARFPMQLHARIVAPVAAAVLVLGSIYKFVWPLTYISALVLFLAIYLGLRNQLRKSRLLVRIGEYSVLIFLLNGVVRFWFLPYAHSPRATLLLGCISAVTSFAVAAVIHALLPRFMTDKFSLASATRGQSHAQDVVTNER